MKVEKYIIFVVIDPDDPGGLTLWNTRADATRYLQREARHNDRRVILERAVRTRP